MGDPSDPSGSDDANTMLSLQKELSTVRQQLTAASEVARWHEKATVELKEQLQAAEQENQKLTQLTNQQRHEAEELRIENEQKSNQIERLVANMKVTARLALGVAALRFHNYRWPDPANDPAIVAAETAR